MEATYRPVQVWAPAIRIIHWAMAFSVLVQIPLGAVLFFHGALGVTEAGEDLVMDIHGTVGLFFGAAVLARIVLLFAGTGAANWRDLVPYTKKQWALAFETVRFYFKGLRGPVPLYFRHNPFASIAYIVFFLFAITQATSGVKLYFFTGHAIEADAGAAQAHENGHVHSDEAEGGFGAEDMHELGAFVIIFFMFAHFGALAAHDIVEKRGLVSAMVNGVKFFNDEERKKLDIKD